MKLSQAHIELVIVKVAGTAILTLALLRLPDIFRAVAQLIGVAAILPPAGSSGEMDAIVSKMNLAFVSSAIGDLGAFLVLLFLARWMFGFPGVVKAAFRRADLGGGGEGVEEAGG